MRGGRGSIVAVVIAALGCGCGGAVNRRDAAGSDAAAVGADATDDAQGAADPDASDVPLPRDADASASASDATTPIPDANGPDAESPDATSNGAVARAFVDVEIASGASMGACNLADTTGFSIGSVPAPGEPVTRVDNGSNSNGPIAVVCSVAASNGGYAIELEADDESTVVGQGGSLRITGSLTASGVGSNVAVNANSGGAAYAESNCTVTDVGFVVTSGATPAPPSIAPGRVYGTVSCPNAAPTANGSLVYCVVTADFVFENCAE